MCAIENFPPGSWKTLRGIKRVHVQEREAEVTREMQQFRLDSIMDEVLQTVLGVGQTLFLELSLQGGDGPNMTHYIPLDRTTDDDTVLTENIMRFNVERTRLRSFSESIRYSNLQSPVGFVNHRVLRSNILMRVGMEDEHQSLLLRVAQIEDIQLPMFDTQGVSVLVASGGVSDEVSGGVSSGVSSGVSDEVLDGVRVRSNVEFSLQTFALSFVQTAVDMGVVLRDDVELISDLFDEDPTSREYDFVTTSQSLSDPLPMPMPPLPPPAQVPPHTPPLRTVAASVPAQPPLPPPPPHVPTPVVGQQRHLEVPCQGTAGSLQMEFSENISTTDNPGGGGLSALTRVSFSLQSSTLLGVVARFFT